jgi:D-3-phosphoglycerate dehydrogenase / 2-oxoglutarate reductase
MKIVILDDYQDAVCKLPCFAKLDGHEVEVHATTAGDGDPGELAGRLRDAVAVVLIRERTRITRELVERLPRLELISQTGKLAGHVDVAACTARGVAVAEGVGSPIAPAELTWALILAARRRLPQYVARWKDGDFQRSSRVAEHDRLGRVLSGDTLGIWGYGKIGRRVAGYGRAFGMNVLVWGREASRAAAYADGFTVAASKDELFAVADVVSLHLRLIEATRGVVLGADLGRMKRDALFVNTSRAELVEPEALEAAVRAGRPGSAAVDVYASEPPGRDHPLLEMENVLCSPHLGYVEERSYELYFSVAFDNVLAYAAGRPVNIANPDALQHARYSRAL